MVKKLTVTFFAFLVLAFTFGCASSVGVKETNYKKDGKSVIMVSYKKLNAKKNYEIAVGEGERVAVEIEIVSKGGSLALTIGRVGFPADYSGNNLETGSFTVYLNEAGTYDMIFLAKDHAGSFKAEYYTIK